MGADDPAPITDFTRFEAAGAPHAAARSLRG
jgi:hypothetical protein